MSIEKNIETLAASSARIAAALEAILAVISNGGGARPTPAVVGSDQPAAVTSGKVVEDTTEADAKAVAKAKAAEKAKAEKAAKEAAAAKAAAKPTGTTVSYDSIKAIVTEMAGTPDGVTAIKQVLSEFDVKKASDLPEEKWGELLAALEKAKGGGGGGSDDAEFA